jgi:hypothetical protein
VLAALLAVALFERKRPSPWLFVLVSALSLSITITNWMAGIAATAVSFPWRRAVQITVAAFCIVTALWGFQKLLYPSAQFFLGSREEARFMFRTEADGPRAILTTFAVDSVVMPDVRVIEDKTVVQTGRRLSVQTSPIGSSGPWGVAAASVWIGLLALGAWALFTLRDQARLRLAPGRTDLGRVADPAQNGLIVGRMDFGRPLLFVNAVSYRGLLDAAILAERSGHNAEATRWRGAAARLQRAWESAFAPPESENDRTFVASLWPTGIGYGIESTIRGELERRWDRARIADGDLREQPLWRYFTVAEAHQWLFVGETDHVLSTLRWFWSHQASPGLYTWWEGLENSFLDWTKIRGWVRPTSITPHYWTAAEMLLLQLDMLGYEPPVPEPSLVIGAGVPREWLQQPLRIQQLSMRSGRLDWTWDGRAVTIQTSWDIDPRRVRLGTAFPPQTPIRIQRF